MVDPLGAVGDAIGAVVALAAGLAVGNVGDAVGAELAVAVGGGEPVGCSIGSAEPQAAISNTTSDAVRRLICQPAPMHYQAFGDRFQLRFASGEKLMENLLRFLAARSIGYASLTGLGALRQATVSYWNASSQQYEGHDIDEQVELVSLIGNATLKDGKAFVHAHVTLGRSDLSVLGGHLNEATVHPNVELWLRPEAHAVERVVDESCGLYLMNLGERL